MTIQILIIRYQVRIEKRIKITNQVLSSLYEWRKTVIEKEKEKAESLKMVYSVSCTK